MAGKSVSFQIKAEDKASSPLNKIAGNLNQLKNSVKSGTSGFTNFAKSLSGLKGAIPGIGMVTAAVAGVVKAIQKGVEKMREWEDAWGKIETSEIRLDMASSLNKELNASGLALEKWAGELSTKLGNTFAGGDIMSAMSSIAFDKSEEQIKSIMSAAVDLSAAMGTDLNTAVQQLDATFSGSVGTLGKMFPELKSLTKEELEAGDAVDIIAEKVKGMGEALSDTTEGSVKRFKNSMGDLKEEFGAEVTGFFQPLRNWLSDISEGWASALKNKRQYMEAQEKIEAGTATSEDVQIQYDEVQKEIEMFENVFGAVPKFMQEYSDKLKAQIDKLDFQETQKKIWDANATLQSMNDMERAARDGKKAIYDQQMQVEKDKLSEEKDILKEVRDYTASDAKINRVRQGLGSVTEKEGYQGDYSRESLMEYLKTTNSTFKDAMDIAGLTSGLTRWEEKFAKDADAYIEKSISALLDEKAQKEMDQRKAMYDAMAEKSDAARKAQAEEAQRELEAIQAMKDSIRQSFTGSMGELGSLIETGIAEGPLGVIEEVTASIVGQLAEANSSISEVFDILSTLTSEFIAPIANMVASVTAPLVPFIEYVGEVIGNLLEVLEPLVSAITGTLTKVLLVTIISVIGSIYNIIVAIQNGVASIYNFFNKKNPMEKWGFLDFSDTISQVMSSNGSAYSTNSSTSTASGSASYSGAKDIYITINFDHSYVNGDEREIALSLMKEMKLAEALGY